MQRSISILAVVLASCAALRAIEVSARITNPANGHTYVLLDAKSWGASETEAQQLGGHLVTIDNAAEQVFVWDHFGAGGQRSLWIGLWQDRRDPTYSEPFGGWRWATGERLTHLGGRSWNLYTLWEARAPNENGVEDHVHMEPLGWPAPGQWNDLHESSSSASGHPIHGVVEMRDAFEVVFPPPGSPADDGSSRATTLAPCDGETIETRVVLVARNPRIAGWSYAVRHDPTVLTLVDASERGTMLDPAEIPNSALTSWPFFQVTRAVHARDDPAGTGPEVGYVQAVIVPIFTQSGLPLGRHAVANATYRIRGALGSVGTAIEFADAELGVPGSPPVALNITCDGVAEIPAVSNARVVRCDRSFVRGDADTSGLIDISDGVVVLDALFRNGRIACELAADADDNGRLEITDAIRIFAWLFTGAQAPPPPAPSTPDYAGADCGPDPTPNSRALGCASAPAGCEGS